MSSNSTQMESSSTFRLIPTDGGPQVEPILAIHRGGDGFVSFHRLAEGAKWENLFSVRADNLDSMFPAFREELLRDSYYSVNSFFRDAGPNRGWPSLGAAYRKTKALRYLNACYADLDCYKAGLDSGMLAGIVLSAQSNGLIPPVSIFARSGRGVWLFWLLEDARTPGQPPRYWPEKFTLYMRIQRVLHDRLSAYGADAHDAVRVTRVPGSIHTGVNEPVTYLFQFDSEGRGFVHTLDSMARSLGLPDVSISGPAKRSGWLALHASRLRQLEMLRDMRGAFREGCRNHALLLYVTFLSKNGYREDSIRENAWRFGEEYCRPSLTDSEVRAAIASGLKRYRVTNRKISDWLMVRPEEVDMLETWHTASCFDSRALPEPRGLSRNDHMKARRDAIQQIVTEVGRVPSVREMDILLQRQCDVTCSWVTVASDYKALGLISEPERKRRRRKQEITHPPGLLSSHAG